MHFAALVSVRRAGCEKYMPDLHFSQLVHGAPADAAKCMLASPSDPFLDAPLTFAEAA
jgi:hypothetical protein